jgi:hypothetical protein
MAAGRRAWKGAGGQTGTPDWAQKKRLAAGNPFHAEEGAGSQRGAVGGEHLRGTAAVNAGSTAKNTKASEERSERTGSSPRTFSEGSGKPEEPEDADGENHRRSAADRVERSCSRDFTGDQRKGERERNGAAAKGKERTGG